MRTPLTVAGARGHRYAELPPALLERLPEWMSARAVPGGEEVRPGRLYRWEETAVKLFDEKPGLKSYLRSSRATLSADAHERLKPIVTPRPLVALSGGPMGPRGSLLAYEWVEGRHLFELWGEDRRAMEAYPAFLLLMHSRRVFHGDLHLLNAVWDGAAWVLLDLDGFRHTLRNLRPARVVEEQWSLACFALAFHREVPAEAARPLFDRYVELGGRIADPDAAWERIRRRIDGHWKDWAAYTAAQR